MTTLPEKKRMYFHGDVAPPPPDAEKFGIGGNWMYDATADAFFLFSPGEKQPCGPSDVRRLKYQLKNKSKILGNGWYRPNDAENVFKAEFPKYTREQLSRKLNQGMAGMVLGGHRLTRHDQLLKTLLCANCGHGELHHADGKCLFDSTSWAPNQPAEPP